MLAVLRQITRSRLGAPRAAVAVFAALYFALVQIAFAAHASSDHAAAPAHDPVNCVLCVAAGGGHAGVPQSDFVFVAPVYAAAITLALLVFQPQRGILTAIRARAPPTF